jgi:hypothetical protein
MDSQRRQFLTAGAAFVAGTFAAGSLADAEAAPRQVTILNGSRPPKPKRGIIGDFFIDTRTHVIYGPKRHSGWGRGTHLIGPAGAPGSTGAAGATGPQGYSILNGPSAPSPSLGEDNDFYIDTGTTQLYGPKEGVWGSPISLTGGANITVIDGGSL